MTNILTPAFCKQVSDLFLELFPDENIPAPLL
jgi:hypothetical protein